MVTFEYRKFDLVSNYREYNLLWSELEVLFDDMPDKNQISADLMYIENNHGSGKVVISNDFDENLINPGP